MKTENKVQAINEYLESQGYHDDMIYTFDEYLINEFFPNSFDALRACHFGDINFTHNYFRFDGYGNIETLSDWKIDELFEDSDFQEWAKENGHIDTDDEE